MLFFKRNLCFLYSRLETDGVGPLNILQWEENDGRFVLCIPCDPNGLLKHLKMASSFELQVISLDYL